MPSSASSFTSNFSRDLVAGLVVFLVALPLCLGVALASNAPLFSGILAGIVGGILVGLLSGSSTSVSGPAAGLTAVVAAQILSLGSFPAFLLAVVLAGVIQIFLGIARIGFLASFFPSSVIKGLLAAIGIILILKQIPHVVGFDTDPEGDMAFFQPNRLNTFTALWELLDSVLQQGAMFIGLLSIAVLIVWDRTKKLKYSGIPSALVVVLLGVGLSYLFRRIGGNWEIESSHMVQVPVANNLKEFSRFLITPDFSQWLNAKVYLAAFTIAIVASLETLLNLQAVDKIDPQQRPSPPNRELIAQGVGNVVAGLIGGLPVTSVIVRSSVNINAGGRTKMSAVIHGIFLLVSVLVFAKWLNLIPVSCLAAILLVTGFKLFNLTLIRKMWKEGPFQFAPFAITVIAIVLTDLLIGVVIGLVISISFILWSNVRRPLRRIVEKHLGGEVVHIILANQVSFLNRARIDQAFDELTQGGHVLIDAHQTDYIDPDVLEMIRDFKEITAPARGLEVSLIGFREKYLLDDTVQFVDYSTRELQSAVTPEQVLQILLDGHQRFRSGNRLSRDLSRQLNATATGQHPLAVLLSCIDSRAPAELIFDVGLGEILSARVAGNIALQKMLGSLEYSCIVAGAKLIMIMGHTNCGAVNAAIDLQFIPSSEVAAATGCEHLEAILNQIRHAIDPAVMARHNLHNVDEKDAFSRIVSRRNVVRTVSLILEQSKSLRDMVNDGRIAIVGSIYDVVTADLTLLTDSKGLPLESTKPEAVVLEAES